MNRVLTPPTAAIRDVTTTVGIAKGGTSAVNSSAAAQALGAYTSSKLGVVNGLAKANGSGKIDVTSLPDAVVTYPTLSGPVQLFGGQVATYTITNYDTKTTYTVSTASGTISVSGDTITYTAPGVLGTYSFTVNGRQFDVLVGNVRPMKPTVVATTSGNNTQANGDFTASAFAMESGVGTHKNSDWEVATDSSFTDLVKASYGDTVNKTAWTATGLSLSSSYFVRVKYRDINNVESSWSDVVSFTTKAKYTPSAEEAKLVATDKAANARFGQAVAMDAAGNRVVIGALMDDSGATADVGSVYIFVRSGSSWTQEQKIQASDKVASDNFGTSVSIDSTATRIVVGSPYADPSSLSAAGACYVYVRSGTTWSFEQKLTASDAHIDDHFGTFVGMDSTGTRFVTCADYYNGTNSFGVLYVFTRSGTTWTQEARLQAPDAGNTAGDAVMYSCAIDSTGTRIALGGRRVNNDMGAVFVFTRTGTSWAQEQKIQPADAVAGDYFGFAVTFSADGSRIAVGSPNHAAGVSLAGAVYIYLRTGTVWTLEKKQMASDRSSGDGFGGAVSLSADGVQLLVGCDKNNPSSLTDAGAAYLYNRSGSVWTEGPKILASDKAISDQYGVAVCMSADGSRFISGARSNAPGGVTGAGAAYIVA